MSVRPYMKKTRKKKPVCGAACFMAAEIKFSKDVRPSVRQSVRPSVRPSVRLQTRFPEFFKKTIGSIHFIPGINPYGVSLLTPNYFCVTPLFIGPLVAKYLAKNGVSGTFRKNYSKFFWNKFFPEDCSTRQQNRNLYWIFLDEVGSDQSGGILSPFMGTACYTPV